MEFMSVRELTAKPNATWEALARDGEIAITNNGKPSALMVSVADAGLDELRKAICQAKAMLAVNSLREKMAARDDLTEERIEAEIQAARAEIRARKNRA